MSVPAVSVSGLSVVYSGQKALDLEKYEFDENRIHVLVGPNGCGKTTLLRVVSGIERPTSGRVMLFGKDLYGQHGSDFLKTMRDVTLCFQKPYLFSTTVRRNIEYGLRFRDLSKSEIEKRVGEAVGSLALEEFLDRNARGLSAGEGQRVAIARAIALKPKIALLDEPVANVDEANKARVESAINTLREGGATLIVATHHVDQAYRLSANVVRLESGRLAPPFLENLLEGEIGMKDGESMLSVKDLKLSVVTEKTGFARASIDPTAIIVSNEKISSSARNCLKGVVREVSEQGGLISIRVDAGAMLTARITKESYKELGINIGSEAYLSFKASAVHIY